MRQHTLSIALLIAASLTPIAGCSDHDESANTPNQNSNLAAEQTADHAGNRSHNDSPIPVNDPNASDKPEATAASKPKPPAPDRVKQLAQQITTIKQTDQKRLNDQAQRIDALEHQIAALTQRLRRLPQPEPSKSNRASGDKQTNAGKQSLPDAVSPQSKDTAAPDQASQSGDHNTAPSNRDDETADDSDAGDAGAESNSAPPASGQAAGPDIVTRCAGHGDTADPFDVFYQAATHDALEAAANKVKSAGLSDWFALARMGRLYVGRYGNWPLAARRRDDVHQRTGLALNIKAVQPHHTSAPKRTNHRQAHDYGAADNAVTSIRRAATEPVQPDVAHAPFTIVGVEIRGTHHYLGVAAHEATRLGGVAWLSPGDAYGTWTLRAIHTDAGTATFAHDGATVAVALPRRG